MKFTIRKKILDLRLSLSADEVSYKSRSINKRLIAMREFIDSKRVMCYSPVKNEVSTEEIIYTAWSQNKEIFLPVTDEDNNLKIYKSDRFIPLIKGRYGISEPDTEKNICIDTEEIEMLIIPGIVFDKEGNRIGYGKGCYDRLLKSFKRKPFKIALAFDLQIFEKIISDVHDIAVDKIVTESGIIDCKELNYKN